MKANTKAKGNASAPMTKPLAAEIAPPTQVSMMPDEKRAAFQKSDRGISTAGATSRASSEATLAKN